MVNKCSILDIDRIIELGKLINNDFDKLNNISELISNDNIFGYYLDDKLVGFIVINKCYEVIDLLYIVVDKLYRNKSIGSKLMEYMIYTFDYERIMLEVRCDNIYGAKYGMWKEGAKKLFSKDMLKKLEEIKKNSDNNIAISALKDFNETNCKLIFVE